MKKLGRIGRGRPRTGKLGTVLVSFLYDSKICRKLVPAVVDSTLKNDVQVHVRPLNGGQFTTSPWLGTKNKRRRKRQNDFQQAKLTKIEINAVESAYMPIIADNLRKDFLGSGCSLIGLNLEVAGRKEHWSSRELLDSEAYVGLLSTRKTLDGLKNNGASDSKVRFYEKLRLLYTIDLSSKLNLAPAAVDAVLESVLGELKNFENA